MEDLPQDDFIWVFTLRRYDGRHNYLSMVDGPSWSELESGSPLRKTA